MNDISASKFRVASLALANLEKFRAMTLLIIKNDMVTINYIHPYYQLLLYLNATIHFCFYSAI